MASSPYLSSDLKAYLRKFDVETLINRTVNDLCRALPEDPYAFIIGQLQKVLLSNAACIANRWSA